jgi:predicted AAA+ superfamily ATPase
MNLTAFIGKPLEKGKTLVFLDEIQECPNARTAIKFLVDDGRFDYIESGSLLGVQYKQVPSYPVGYEEIYQMYPMDFEEFCIANGVQQSTLDYLHECYEKQKPITDSIHQTMSNLFKYYIVVGGMPDVVRKFIDTHDIGQVSAVQRDIIAQYRQDISKYAATGKNMINNIFDNIPSQLNDKNRRFMLSSIQKSARLRDYEDSFVWLSDAGVALPCYNLTEPKIPLKINEQSRLFKLYMSDVGLLCAMSLENVQFEILKGNLSINMGGILKNAFAELLKANGFSLRYLNKKNIGELDFVVQQNDEVMPIEIKSGKDYQTHAALNNALKVKDWNLKKGLVFCMDNIRKTEKITYLPWYLVMFLKQDNSDESMIVNVDLNGL